MTKQTIDDIDVAGRRVLVRVDFNVPVEDGRIVDDRRIRAALPTLRSLLERGARCLVVTHFGRPKGQVVDTLRVAPLAERLSDLLGVEVPVAADVAGEDARRVSAELHDGGIAMLENVRFEPGEERNDFELSRRLAGLADLYVNDAFGAAHRAHSSTEGVAHLLPAVAGYLMAREVEVLSGILDRPRRPLVAIVGGSKISTKIAVIRSLLARVDTLWIGGAMACTFYRALGEETGRSLVEEDQIPIATELLDLSHAGGSADLRLPVDLVVAPAPQAGSPTADVSWKAIPASQMVVDVGPETVEAIAASCADAATVVWNGPLGIYEIEDFAQGTRNLGRALVQTGATTVIGGGDLAAALDAARVTSRISHVSTGGGATLEFLEGRTLPGVAILLDREAEESGAGVDAAPLGGGAEAGGIEAAGLGAAAGVAGIESAALESAADAGAMGVAGLGAGADVAAAGAGAAAAGVAAGAGVTGPLAMDGAGEASGAATQDVPPPPPPAAVPAVPPLNLPAFEADIPGQAVFAAAPPPPSVPPVFAAPASERFGGLGPTPRFTWPRGGASGRRPLVAGNWKMNTTIPEGLELLRRIIDGVNPSGVDVAVLPPFTHLWSFREPLAATAIGLGAQNAFWQDKGAYTGEIAPAFLDGWCDYVLLGHSERRHILGETDEMVNRKLRLVLTHPFYAIVAVGETLDEREEDRTLDVVHRQIDGAFEGVDAADMARVIVAYEPVWAIGTGRTATAEQAQEVCRAIRLRIASRYSVDVAAAVRILYGGSITAANAESLFAERDIDGGLVGGASLDAEAFAAIVAAATPASVGG